MSRKVINCFVLYSKVYIETWVDFHYPESGKMVWSSWTYSAGPGRESIMSIDLIFKLSLGTGRYVNP